MSTNNSTRSCFFVNRYCFCNTELRTATITKIKGLSIQTQQNTFVLFTLFKLTLDECKTLTKISTRKTSHNRSPKPAHASDDKETGRKPSIKRQTTRYRKETFATPKCLSVQLSWAPRPCIRSWRLSKKVRSPN